MVTKRHIEVFGAGCSCCAETVELITKAACPSCEVSVLDMRTPEVAERTRSFGIHSVPAVVIDGKLADCCFMRGPEMATLRAAGIGVPLDPIPSY